MNLKFEIVFVFKLLQLVRFKIVQLRMGAVIWRLVKLIIKFKTVYSTNSHEMTLQPKLLVAACLWKNKYQRFSAKVILLWSQTGNYSFLNKYVLNPFLFLYEEILPVTGKTQAGLHAH